MVCNSDRTGLAATLADIRDLAAQLREDPDPLDHQDWVAVPVPSTDPRRRPEWLWWRGGRADDPLSRVLPAGIVPSSLGAGARVSGSKEPAAPTDLDRLDMLKPPRPAILTPQGWAFREDHIGTVAVAAPLYQLARIWRQYLFPDQALPPVTVPELVRWLGDRLAEACDSHPAIDEFASEMQALKRALRGKLGLNAPPRQRCDGVPCKACDRIALYREGGLVSCGYCGQNYSDREYRDWVKLEAPYALAQVRDGEVAPKNPDELRRMVA